MKTELVRARVDPAIKKKVERIVERNGYHISDVLRILCYNIAATGQMPDLRIPNKETVEAFNEPVSKLPRFKNVDDLFEELKK
jgi:addiction module RelB/DinJ family antitoxin